jgi:hypothetical protein
MGQFELRQSSTGLSFQRFYDRVRIPMKRASVPGIKSHLLFPRLRTLRSWCGGSVASRCASSFRQVEYSPFAADCNPLRMV